MAQSRRTKHEWVFQHRVPVKVKRLKIQRAASLAYLDIDKLSRAARAEFDLGYVKAGDRRSAVQAIVRKGMVVGLRTELCANCRPARMTAELRQLLKAVSRRIGGGARPPARGVPVAVFLRQQQPERSECYMICWWFTCFICCGFPSDPDSWSCSIPGGSYPREFER